MQSTALEIKTATHDIKTKREVAAMIKPLVNGFTENSVHTTKLQLDVSDLLNRVEQLEVVFNAGKGKNFIYDKLMNRIAQEKAEREMEVQDLKHYFVDTRDRVQNLMGDIKAAETKFMTFREEMVVFKASLDEYYAFFVARCEEIIKLMQDN